jgi:hypothetical protein
MSPPRQIDQEEARVLPSHGRPARRGEREVVRDVREAALQDPAFLFPVDGNCRDSW